MQGNFLVFAHASPRACPRRASLVVRIQFKIHSNFVQYTPQNKEPDAMSIRQLCFCERRWDSKTSTGAPLANEDVRVWSGGVIARRRNYERLTESHIFASDRGIRKPETTYYAPSPCFPAPNLARSSSAVRSATTCSNPTRARSSSMVRSCTFASRLKYDCCTLSAI